MKQARKSIVWLASYPKSGNTWFRIFLSTIRGETVTTPDINDLNRTPIASARGLFEDQADLESSDLTLDETDCLRPEVYRQLAAEQEERLFLKIHDAFTRTPNDEWMFPPEVTWGVIYLVRNPLDVAVSLANHNSRSIDQCVHDLCNESYGLCRGKNQLANQLRQMLLTWSDHVISWLDSPNPLCLLRYEDMVSHPLETFRKALDFLELPRPEQEIQAALDLCRIDRLQEQETQNRFKEKPQHCHAFFRKGVVGDWRNHLSDSQVDDILKAHYDVMKQLGYLDDQDRLTV